MVQNTNFIKLKPLKLQQQKTRKKHTKYVCKTANTTLSEKKEYFVDFDIFDLRKCFISDDNVYYVGRMITSRDQHENTTQSLSAFQIFRSLSLSLSLHLCIYLSLSLSSYLSLFTSLSLHLSRFTSLSHSLSISLSRGLKNDNL